MSIRVSWRTQKQSEEPLFYQLPINLISGSTSVLTIRLHGNLTNPNIFIVSGISLSRRGELWSRTAKKPMIPLAYFARNWKDIATLSRVLTKTYYNYLHGTIISLKSPSNMYQKSRVLDTFTGSALWEIVEIMSREFRALALKEQQGYWKDAKRKKKCFRRQNRFI